MEPESQKASLDGGLTCGTAIPSPVCPTPPLLASVGASLDEAEVESGLSAQSSCAASPSTSEKSGRSSRASLSATRASRKKDVSDHPLRPKVLLSKLALSGVDDAEDGRKSSASNPHSRSSTPDKSQSNSASKRKNSSSSINLELSASKKKKTNKSSTLGASEQCGVLNDNYCWECHRDGEFICCEMCPRVYHLRCANLESAPPQDWACHHCHAIMLADNVENRSRAMQLISVDQLGMMLKFALKRAKKTPMMEPFTKPVDVVQFPTYHEVVLHPVDFTTLEANINNRVYGSTEAFVADVGWILHNSVIFNGANSKVTNLARTAVKIIKQEMSEIETCPDCYMNAHQLPDTWFTEACRLAHPLVWARLKGFPYWPAKAVKWHNSSVDVRFFGRHDKAWVSAKDCYLLSEKMPVALKGRNKTLESCMTEVKAHIECLKKRFGSFVYAPHKLPFSPSDPQQVQVLLPLYKGPPLALLHALNPSSAAPSDDETSSVGSSDSAASSRRSRREKNINEMSSDVPEQSTPYESISNQPEESMSNFEPESEGIEITEHQTQCLVSSKLDLNEDCEVTDDEKRQDMAGGSNIEAQKFNKFEEKDENDEQEAKNTLQDEGDVDAIDGSAMKRVTTVTKDHFVETLNTEDQTGHTSGSVLEVHEQSSLSSRLPETTSHLTEENYTHSVSGHIVSEHTLTVTEEGDLHTENNVSLAQHEDLCSKDVDSCDKTYNSIASASCDKFAATNNQVHVYEEEDVTKAEESFLCGDETGGGNVVCEVGNVDDHQLCEEEIDEETERRLLDAGTEEGNDDANEEEEKLMGEQVECASPIASGSSTTEVLKEEEATDADTNPLVKLSSKSDGTEGQASGDGTEVNINYLEESLLAFDREQEQMATQSCSSDELSDHEQSSPQLAKMQSEASGMFKASSSVAAEAEAMFSFGSLGCTISAVTANKDSISFKPQGMKKFPLPEYGESKVKEMAGVGKGEGEQEKNKGCSTGQSNGGQGSDGGSSDDGGGGDRGQGVGGHGRKSGGEDGGEEKKGNNFIKPVLQDEEEVEEDEEEDDFGDEDANDDADENVNFSGELQALQKMTESRIESLSPSIAACLPSGVSASVCISSVSATKSYSKPPDAAKYPSLSTDVSKYSDDVADETARTVSRSLALGCTITPALLGGSVSVAVCGANKRKASDLDDQEDQSRRKKLMRLSDAGSNASSDEMNDPEEEEDYEDDAEEENNDQKISDTASQLPSSVSVTTLHASSSLTIRETNTSRTGAHLLPDSVSVTSVSAPLESSNLNTNDGTENSRGSDVSSNNEKSNNKSYTISRLENTCTSQSRDSPGSQGSPTLNLKSSSTEDLIESVLKRGCLARLSQSDDSNDSENKPSTPRRKSSDSNSDTAADTLSRISKQVSISSVSAKAPSKRDSSSPDSALSSSLSALGSSISISISSASVSNTSSMVSSSSVSVIRNLERNTAKSQKSSNDEVASEKSNDTSQSSKAAKEIPGLARDVDIKPTLDASGRVITSGSVKESSPSTATATSGSSTASDQKTRSSPKKEDQSPNSISGVDTSKINASVSIIAVSTMAEKSRATSTTASSRPSSGTSARSNSSSPGHSSRASPAVGNISIKGSSLLQETLPTVPPPPPLSQAQQTATSMSRGMNFAAPGAINGPVRNVAMMRGMAPGLVVGGGRMACPPLRPQNMQGVVPPPEAGHLSQQLHQHSHKLAEIMRASLEEVLSGLVVAGTPEARVAALQLELERSNWRHQQEVMEVRHNSDIMLGEMRASLEAEKHRAVEEMRRSMEQQQVEIRRQMERRLSEKISEVKRQCDVEKQRAVEDTKKKQWCANCGKEALFFCCWNTSYCDYPCQQAHWPHHMAVCGQNSDGGGGGGTNNGAVNSHEAATAAVTDAVNGDITAGQHGSRGPTPIHGIVSQGSCGGGDVSVGDDDGGVLVNEAVQIRPPLLVRPQPRLAPLVKKKKKKKVHGASHGNENPSTCSLAKNNITSVGQLGVFSDMLSSLSSFKDKNLDIISSSLMSHSSNAAILPPITSKSKIMPSKSSSSNSVASSHASKFQSSKSSESPPAFIKNSPKAWMDWFIEQSGSEGIKSNLQAGKTKTKPTIHATPVTFLSSDAMPKKKKRKSTPCVRRKMDHVLTPEEITQEMLDRVAKTPKEKTHDQETGTSCHQCRQKTADFKTICRSGSCVGLRGYFCGPCLNTRYGEDARTALLNPTWHCPVCRKICNCSLCRKAYDKDSLAGFKIGIQGRGSPTSNPDTSKTKKSNKLAEVFRRDRVSIDKSNDLSISEAGEESRGRYEIVSHDEIVAITSTSQTSVASDDGLGQALGGNKLSISAMDDGQCIIDDADEITVEEIKVEIPE
ncbi:uncharacterized protein LOC108677761 isoform X2 [Hyalella azteca]|nr:uncharacterized protein LOC108677761 isoform X2 [Hyalella azteca]